MSGLAKAFLFLGSMIGLICGAIFGWGSELIHIHEQQHFRLLALGAIIAFIQSKEKLHTFGTMAAGCFGIFILYFIAWNAWSHPQIPGPSEALDESAIEHTYMHINGCNHLYAQANPEKGFVASLDQLGPAGMNCLTPAEQSGEIGNRKLLYEPGMTANGKVITYRLVAIHITPENHAPSLSDPGFSPLE